MAKTANAKKVNNYFIDLNIIWLNKKYILFLVLLPTHKSIPIASWLQK